MFLIEMKVLLGSNHLPLVNSSRQMNDG